MSTIIIIDMIGVKFESIGECGRRGSAQLSISGKGGGFMIVRFAFTVTF